MPTEQYCKVYILKQLTLKYLALVTNKCHSYINSYKTLNAVRISIGIYVVRYQ